VSVRRRSGTSLHAAARLRSAWRAAVTPRLAAGDGLPHGRHTMAYVVLPEPLTPIEEMIS